MASQALIGQRIRRMRRVCNLGQEDFAKQVGLTPGSVSKLENGRMPLTGDMLDLFAATLLCTRQFLESEVELAPTTRPWLRAYADAPKRQVDRIVDDCTTAMEAVVQLDLRLLPDSLPRFAGDLTDPSAIEDFACEVRAVAGLDDGGVVGNATRAAERLGCVILPMPAEAGRHLGLSLWSNLVPMIRVGRRDADGRPVPGDRQRWTVAHELGHLTLHGDLGAPATAEESKRIEKQAHLFASAFLAPGDAMLDELHNQGGRVTLQTLLRIKALWGVSVRSLVTRFRTLGVIDDAHSRSLFKQISARGWNKDEPGHVGNEKAVWMATALAKAAPRHPAPLREAALRVGLDEAHLVRWTDWSELPDTTAEVMTPDFTSRHRSGPRRQAGTISLMQGRTLTRR